MSERKWTEEQKQAINLTGANILVSAAAGSGKTSVLVERIINKIVNEKVDIDKILVVTFTNAAASEMRQRIMDEIYRKIEENPNDENLQRQLLLINKANISTIHSFCLNVIRNNFFQIGFSSNFRVGDETEIEIMKQEVMEELFEEKYENNDKNFLDLLNRYTSYKDDTALKEIILKVYEFIQSNPFPQKWLKENVEEYNLKEENFENTKWGKIILNHVKEIIENDITILKSAILELDVYQNLLDFSRVLNTDLKYLSSMKLESWDNSYMECMSKSWEMWPRKSKISEEEKEVKERAKNIRDGVKKDFEEVKNLINCTSKDAIEDIKKMYKTLKSIEKLVLEFENEFSKRKREKNIVDFNDIEHLALKILVNEEGSKTETAKKYEFNEIEIDEYQDSNSVQEYILNSVSNGKNIFMVGDVKQSIYKFRQANPKLFMDKYDKYILPEKEIKEDTKILLYKNFRSRKNILDITNLVFDNIMSKKLGEIEYTEDEALNLGGSFEEPKIDIKTELSIVETNQEENEELEEVVENAALEARLVARKINNLIKQGVKYKDITILLRSPKAVANIYEKELSNAGIPVFSDVTTEYLDTIEIDTIMSVLKIIDNPLQDIPLVTVLRSMIGGFTDNELIEIRLVNKSVEFFKAVKEAENSSLVSECLKRKITNFLNLIDKLKEEEEKLPLNEFIWEIYNKTGYYHYAGLMPGGNLRQANLKKLFEKAKEYEKISFKGLFNFIIFMEKVGKGAGGIEAARVIGENDDVVRIMSIHKSKGLEFPIVFLCNSNKKFNLRDMSERIILDNKIGIGANYLLDGVEFPLLTKEAIKLKNKVEAISEEMRVLYVALTRAKDKLIIVGTSENVEKKLEEKRQELAKYYRFKFPKKLNPRIVEKYRSYLDWIELVYVYNKESNIDLEVVNKTELIEEKGSEVEEKRKKRYEVIEKIEKHKINQEEYEKIDKLLNFKYRYEKDIDLPTKTSVTAIKKLEEEKTFEINIDKEERKKPEFSKKDENVGAKRGTVIHYILSKIEHEKNISEVENMIKNLVTRGSLAKEDTKLINNKIIENYLNSELYAELQDAKIIKRETPFYLNIDSNEIYEGTDEKILVQGVIDLFYISKNNELVLVDYKTDYAKETEELSIKYKKQLELYKRALEKDMKRPVDKTYIYSTYLNKNIEIKF